MLTIKGRKKCSNCKKRYNFYYAKTENDERKVKYKGNESNEAQIINVKILSLYSYEITAKCPECNKTETFIYTD